jgi:hypothetical protein
MRSSLLLCAVAASALSIAGAAAAADPAPAAPAAAPAAATPAAATAPVDVKAGQWIYTSDGMAVGRIDIVDKDKAGKPETAEVIRDMRMVYIPVSTLSPGKKGYVTTMTRKDIER